MDWIKSAQEVIPWLAGLGTVPKVMVSALITGAAALLLVLVWTPPAETAVIEILQGCYRRALFTRMHAQLSTEAMFSSVGKCREVLQSGIPRIHKPALRAAAVDLMAAVEQIERKNPISSPEDLAEINRLKLQALKGFRQLAQETKSTFELPARGSLGESAYFTQEEADGAPGPSDFQYQQRIDETTGETLPAAKP